MRITVLLISLAILCACLTAFGQIDGYDMYENDGWNDDYENGGYDMYEDYGWEEGYYYGLEDDGNAYDDYICFECPVCHTVFELTPLEAEFTNPYTICPVCYSAYAWQFIQVPCQEDSEKAPEPVSDGTDSEVIVPTAEVEGAVLMVLPPEDYQELEFSVPKNYFISKGLDVKIASKGVSEAKGSEGSKTLVDLDAKDADLSQYDAVVFIGGMGIDNLNLYEDADFTGLASGADQAGLVVGAICLAPKILANADLLDGINATSSDPDYIKSKGANFLDQDVVIEGYIVTANGPFASQKFAEAVVDVIAERNAPLDTHSALSISFDDEC